MIDTFFISIWEVALIVALAIQLRIIICSRGKFPVNILGLKIETKQYFLFMITCSILIIMLFLWSLLRNDMQIIVGLFLTFLFVLQNLICNEIRKREEI